MAYMVVFFSQLLSLALFAFLFINCKESQILDLRHSLFLYNLIFIIKISNYLKKKLFSYDIKVKTEIFLFFSKCLSQNTYTLPLDSDFLETQNLEIL